MVSFGVRAFEDRPLGSKVWGGLRESKKAEMLGKRERGSHQFFTLGYLSSFYGRNEALLFFPLKIVP